MTAPIAIVNHSTVCTDDEIRHYVAAIQSFMPEFCKAWGLPLVDIGFVPKMSTIDDGMWMQIIADDADQAGVLGYHEMTRTGLPVGYTFAATDKNVGALVSVTLTHELFEMLADPHINQWVQEPGSGRRFAWENADAVEADSNALSWPMLPSGPNVKISDFVLPQYFEFNAPTGVAYDYNGLLKSPIPAMLSGGYLAYQNPDGSWEQIDAQLSMTQRAQARPHVLSRRYRRMFKTWQRSAA